MNAPCKPLTGARLTTLLRFGRALEGQAPRPVRPITPKVWRRNVETFTHVSGRCLTASKRHKVIVSRSVADVTVARVEWMERACLPSSMAPGAQRETARRG